MLDSKHIALVTGGSKGIGLETVLRLLAQNYQVITCSRTRESWQQAVLKENGLSQVDYLQLDMSIETERDLLFSHIKSQYNRLDVMINNASPKIESLGIFESRVSSELEHTMMQDFWAHALCLKQSLGLMTQGGAVVNISSINGLRATPNAAMYSACKHAIEGLTRSVAIEAIEKGVRVNAVAPGVTWTPRWDERVKDDLDIKAKVIAQVPIKRFAMASEVVDAIEFLISPKASYIVGHTLVVDGGLSLI